MEGGGVGQVGGGGKKDRGARKRLETKRFVEKEKVSKIVRRPTKWKGKAE